jgi:hypothetical protein
MTLTRSWWLVQHVDDGRPVKAGRFVWLELARRPRLVDLAVGDQVWVCRAIGQYRRIIAVGEVSRSSEFQVTLSVVGLQRWWITPMLEDYDMRGILDPALSATEAKVLWSRLLDADALGNRRRSTRAVFEERIGSDQPKRRSTPREPREYFPANQPFIPGRGKNWG